MLKDYSAFLDFFSNFLIACSLSAPSICSFKADKAPISPIVDFSAVAAAGLSGIRVGTVDKFQGQEAAAVIVSLAASSNQDAPRGLEFVLNRNRLNVAVSRAQVACYLVHSPGLLEADFDSVEQLLAISRFIGLLEHATGDSAAIEAKP